MKKLYVVAVVLLGIFVFSPFSESAEKNIAQKNIGINSSPIKIANKFLIDELKKCRVNTSLYKFNIIESKQSIASRANYLRFQETYKGIPVANSEVVLCIPGKGEITLANGNISSGIKIPTTSPKITKKKAIEIILPDLRYPSKYKVINNSLKILPYKYEYFLAWEIIITSNSGDYLYYVNAINGNIITRYSQLIPLDGRGSGYGRSPFRGNLEELTLKNLDGSGYLRGNYAEVLLYSGNYTSRYSTISRNLDFTATDSSNAIIDEVMAYYHTNKVHDYFKNELSFNGLDRQMEVVVHVQRDTPSLERAPTCYARYRDTDRDGQTGEIFVWDGHGVEVEDWMWKLNGTRDRDTSLTHFLRFSREAEIFYHEYTHAVVYSLLPNRNYLAGHESSGVDEALADYFSCSTKDDPNHGEYVRWPWQKYWHSGHNCYNPDQYPEPLRRMNWYLYLRYPEDVNFFRFVLRIENYPDPDAEILWPEDIDWHGASQLLSNAYWDIRELIGKNWTDKIIFESINGLTNDGTFRQAATSLLNAANLIIDRAPFTEAKKARYIYAINDILIRRGLLSDLSSNPTIDINTSSQDIVINDSPEIYILDAQPGIYILEAKWDNPISEANPLVEMYDEETKPVVNTSYWPGIFGELHSGYCGHSLIPVSRKGKIANTRSDVGKFLFEVIEPSRFFIKIKTNELGEDGPFTLSIRDYIPPYSLDKTFWESLDRKSPRIYSFTTDEDGIISIADRWIGQTGNINHTIKLGTGYAGSNSPWEMAYPMYLSANCEAYIIFEPPTGMSGDFTFTLFNEHLYREQIPDLTFLNAQEIISSLSRQINPTGLTTSYNGEIEIINQTITRISTPFEVSWILNGQVIARHVVNEPISAGGSVRFNMNFAVQQPLQDYKLILAIDYPNVLQEASEINNVLTFEEGSGEPPLTPFPDPEREPYPETSSPPEIPTQPSVYIDIKWLGLRPRRQL